MFILTVSIESFCPIYIRQHPPGSSLYQKPFDKLHFLMYVDSDAYSSTLVFP